MNFVQENFREIAALAIGLALTIAGVRRFRGKAPPDGSGLRK